VWQAVLGLDNVGIHDNFFDLGGNSLLMAQVHSRLREAIDADISMVDLFQYPTISALAHHLRRDQRRGAQPQSDSQPGRVRQVHNEQADTAIAIVGMNGRFPGADNVANFWQNLRDGVESIRFFSDEELAAAGVEPELLSNHNYVKARAVLDNIGLFDATFFSYNPREAAIMDPQHRIFLECAWQALENAGYDADRYPGRIGVYAGVGLNTYLLYANRDILESAGRYQAFIANDKDFVPTRVSYKLNLRGPSINIQTACSSSLVAVHLACQSLLQGECDMALAGGVAISVPHNVGYLYEEGGILSPDGHCRAFDAQAAGTIFGSGVGVVVLKRLQDALDDGDTIHAIIKGSATNNDGSVKATFTAPSVEGQVAMIIDALAGADVDADTISYVEAHGTGTALGDPIEVAALTQVFRTRTQQTGFCALGSVKTNIGHLDAAAGVAGLIKTVLALKHRQLPPSLHFEAPNPKIDFASSPFYVSSTLRDWTPPADVPRRAGVSSFGIGGTNAHVVLEEAPAPMPTLPARHPHQLPVLSTKNDTALEQATDDLVAHLRQHPESNLADVAYTLQIGRKSFEHRHFVVCRDHAEALAALEGHESDRLVTGSPTE
jgi:acyl transferase domain-containing protein